MAAAYGGKHRVRYADVFASWAETYIVHEVGPNSAKRYAVSLRQLQPYLIELFMDEIDKAKIEEIVAGRRAQGVVTATIKRDLVALGSVLKFADVDDNPALARLKKLKERRDPIVLPIEEHIARVVARAPGRMADVIRAARLTGCRLEELVTAERKNLDLSRRQLAVIGKGNKLRTISLSLEACDLLRAVPPLLGCKWLFWHPVQYFERSGVQHRAYNGAVGPERRTVGEPYKNLSSRFAALVKAEHAAASKRAVKLGHQEPDFRPFRFHDLRHAYAVDYLKRRVGSIYDLKEQLGHESVKTTEQVYLKFLDPAERRVAMYGAPAGEGGMVLQLPTREA